MHPRLVEALETFKLLIKGQRSSSVYDGTSSSSVENTTKPLIDDTLVEEQSGETEISTFPEVNKTISDPTDSSPSSSQLNGEPHTQNLTEPEAQFIKMHSEEGHSGPHIADERTTIDPNMKDGAGTGWNSTPISDGQGRTGLPADEHLNKVSVGSLRKDLTIEDLRVYYPNIASRLATYGVLTVDKQKFEAFYKECTKKAMFSQKPISEVLKDA